MSCLVSEAYFEEWEMSGFGTCTIICNVSLAKAS